MNIKRRIFIIALSPLVIILVLTEFLGWALVDSSKFLYRKLCEIKEAP